jgi:hypothetical protein
MVFDNITFLPYIHGKLAFTQYLRKLCLSKKFDCIAIDLPSCIKDDLFDAVIDLPYISAVIITESENKNNIVYYAPADPCDSTIEAIRQSMQNHIKCFFIGFPKINNPPFLPLLPDEYAITNLEFEAYISLCLRVISKNKINNISIEENNENKEIFSQYIAHKLLELKTEFSSILCLVHLSRISYVIDFLEKEKTYNVSFPKPPLYNIKREFINPNHLYFALGELPYVAGKFEQERSQVFSLPIDLKELIKNLFTQTRDEYYNDKDEVSFLNPSRIQSGLTFLRNLTVMDSRLIPNLFDIITAAKGIGGNKYALNVLKNAKYYPFIPYEFENSFIDIGINKIKLPNQNDVFDAINIFRDIQLYWKKLSIRPEPPDFLKKKYRYSWNPFSACSHIPEDKRIENFNSYIRKKASLILCEEKAITEKFMVSIKDGIDIRETMRNWFTKDIYVKEIPPSYGKTDMVVIIFDSDHDEKYPHCATWYAEHDKESTLTFYATDPFENMIGPGIARSLYGGLSLLFPPRLIPNIFELSNLPLLKNKAEYLAYGALIFSKEKIIPYVSAKKPSVKMSLLSQKFKKHFIWIPISSFSLETITKLRVFHILNGKIVRSWASRFIGD